MFLFLLFSGRLLCASVDTLQLFDSTEVKISRPSKASEEKIFSDSKLKYDHKIEAKKGLFERFLEWLTELLFDKAGYDNISITREIIIWTIIVISVIVVVWLLLRSEMVSLIKPKAKAAAFNFSDITEDLDTIDFNKRINDAFEKGDYRLAIRWHYLKMLYLLDIKIPMKT